MKIQRYKKYNDRENILIELIDFESIPKSIDLPLPFFHATIFADFDEVSNNDPLFEFLDLLLEKGGVYFICGGTAGGKVHHCVDELIDIDEANKIKKYPLQSGKPPFQEGDCIMTTSHNDDSVEEVVWFALNVAYSPDVCMKENPANLFFLMQNSPYLKKVKECLEDPSFDTED